MRRWTSRRRVSGFSGFRGAALNQSRSASGVYTSLICWHRCGYQESASCGRCDMWLRSVRNTMPE
ncbi:TPA: hypothetical protein HNC89_24945 [Escherichia coli]|nr:hypothetical protein EIA13_26430 [Escherichia coli]HAJ6784864.1 hypothetical protein [Escherichia coli]